MVKERNTTLCKIENIINNAFGPKGAEWGYVNDQINKVYDNICEKYFDNNFELMSEKISQILSCAYRSNLPDFRARNLYILSGLIANIVHEKTNLYDINSLLDCVKVEFVEPKYPSRFYDEILRLSFISSGFVNMFNTHYGVYSKPIYIGDDGNICGEGIINLKTSVLSPKINNFDEFDDMSYLKDYFKEMNSQYNIIYKVCEEIIQNVFKHVY